MKLALSLLLLATPALATGPVTQQALITDYRCGKTACTLRFMPSEGASRLVLEGNREKIRAELGEDLSRLLANANGEQSPVIVTYVQVGAQACGEIHGTLIHIKKGLSVSAQAPVD